MDRKLTYPVLRDGGSLVYQWAPCYRIWATERASKIAIIANRTGLISLARICMTLAHSGTSCPLHDHLEVGTDLEDGSTELTLVLEGDGCGVEGTPTGDPGEVVFDIPVAGSRIDREFRLGPSERVESAIDGDGLTITASWEGFVALARIFMTLAEPEARFGTRVVLSRSSGLGDGPAIEIEKAAPVEEGSPSRPRAWKVWASEAWREEEHGDAEPLVDGTLLLGDRGRAFFTEACGLVASPSDEGAAEGLPWRLSDAPEVGGLVYEEVDLAQEEDGSVWIRRYALAPERIAGYDLFRLKGDPTCGIYASQRLFERWLEAGLAGLAFQLVWDSSYEEQPVFATPEDDGPAWVDEV